MCEQARLSPREAAQPVGRLSLVPPKGITLWTHLLNQEPVQVVERLAHDRPVVLPEVLGPVPNDRIDQLCTLAKAEADDEV